MKMEKSLATDRNQNIVNLYFYEQANLLRLWKTEVEAQRE